jgi:hypothetical protein
VKEHIGWGPLKWRLATQKLVENRTEAVLIASRKDADLSSFGLFRCHVGRSAQDHARRKGNLTGFRPIRDPKVHQVGRTCRIKPDIGGLDIAMHDAQAVRVLQCLGKFEDDFGCTVEGYRAITDQLREALALYELHGDIVMAAVTSCLIDGDDARVMKLGQRTCFSQKPFEGPMARNRPFTRKFQGYLALEQRIKGSVNRGIPTFTQPLKDTKSA